jgi:hypothetical protein
MEKQHHKSVAKNAQNALTTETAITVARALSHGS